MEKKKFGDIFAGAGNRAKDILEKSKDQVTNVLDQNDDGQLDIKDVSKIAESVGGALSRGAQTLKDATDEKLRQYELDTLKPIFASDLDDESFCVSKIIRVTDRDKRHAESEVCKGSIGYYTDTKDVRVINIFLDSIDTFGLSFYPNRNSSFYYVDACRNDYYVSVEEYFDHLKIARISELEKIAQALGAKHFRVTFMEEQESHKENDASKYGRGDKRFAGKANIDAEKTYHESRYSKVELASENTFKGHAPVRPELHYMKRDPSVQSLIDMRMNELSPLLHQKYMLKMSNTMGMTENDAAQVDAALKGMKFNGNIKFVSEVKSQARSYLEYEIEF